MRSFILFLFSVSILVSCTNIEKSTNNDKQYGGILKTNMPYIPKTLYPPGINDIVSSQLVSQIHAGLVKLGASNLAPYPSVARNWKVDETETKIIFNLRTDAFFHDDPCFENGKGRKITPADIKYSLELLCMQNIENKNFNLVSNIKGAKLFFESKQKNGVEGIKIINDSTLEISLENPNPKFVNFLANPACAILPKEAIEKYGTSNLVGAGAFILKEMPSSDKIAVLKRFDKFFLKNENNKTLPFLDEVHISFGLSASGEIKQFIEGGFDLITGLSQQTAQEVTTKYIEGFQSKSPKYILSSVPDSSIQIYNLHYPFVKGFYANTLNYLDFSVIYFEKADSLQAK